MTSFGFDNGRFEPQADTDSLAARPQNEGSNVCRSAALATLLQGGREETVQVEQVLGLFGFRDPRALAERDWRRESPLGWLRNTVLTVDDLDGTRVQRWLTLNETSQASDAVAFLIAVLASTLERESAASAAALWRGIAPRVRRLSRRPPLFPIYERVFDVIDDDMLGWSPRGWIGDYEDVIGEDRFAEAPSEPVAWDPDLWQRVFQRIGSIAAPYGDRYINTDLVLVLARWRLERALRSPDPITRSFALSALNVPAAPEPDDDPPSSWNTPPVTSPPGTLVVSTIVHGTWGWKGDWWRPNGGFHSFILNNYRQNLHNRGARFSWSGAYSNAQRILAANDFIDWASDVSPHGVQTLFGHSYGGEIAARARLAGTSIHELVYLSTPTSPPVVAAAARTPVVVDIRLQYDPVLGIARRGQRIRGVDGVREVLLNHSLDHGASHNEQVWKDEGVAQRARL
ncbi:MAG TPA: alpha/beta hydrolase [Pseudonocardiaceae bacterium]|jgi:hypothetical protein|nr:alpha/beta hydrolase [Pseudonocardiaceae bacterium]